MPKRSLIKGIMSLSCSTVALLCIFFTCCVPILSLFMAKDSPDCYIRLNDRLELKFRYISSFDQSTGTRVSFSYSGEEEIILAYTSENIYNRRSISYFPTQGLDENFCKDISIEKTADVYLIGNSFILQEDAEFFLGESLDEEYSLRDNLNQLLKAELESEYDGIIIDTFTSEIKIKKVGNKFITYPLEIAVPPQKKDYSWFEYEEIGEITFSVDYSKSRSWSIEEVNFK